MSLPDELLDHALSLAATWNPQFSTEANMRRAVSAAYYALFHQINEDAAAILAPNVSAETKHRIQRWFDHTEMKRICGRFLKETLDQPLLGLIGKSASADMQTVCRKFNELQDARHNADYDLNYQLTPVGTFTLVRSAQSAINAWKRIRHSPEANVFILSLLLWKNWEDKERR